MLELGQLEKNHEAFAQRGVRIYAVSNDDEPTSQLTQIACPHLIVVSDSQQQIAKAMEVLHPGASPNQTDTNAPTTFLVDGTGTVQWRYRPARITDRLSAVELLEAIDQTMPTR